METKVVETKVKGISGSSKICVIHPYKVLSISGSKEETKDQGVLVKACKGIKKFFKKIF